ncbi:MAG: hypothetical protein DRP60_09155 [Spirochaetes bacterium]|nr:MAG: hypothetical protein DRP60_09155 [Spirochaetota bacterium]
MLSPGPQFTAQHISFLSDVAQGVERNHGDMKLLTGTVIVIKINNRLGILREISPIDFSLNLPE